MPTTLQSSWLPTFSSHCWVRCSFLQELGSGEFLGSVWKWSHWSPRSVCTGEPLALLQPGAAAVGRAPTSHLWTLLISLPLPRSLYLRKASCADGTSTGSGAAELSLPGCPGVRAGIQGSVTGGYWEGQALGNAKTGAMFPRELTIIFDVYHGSIHFTPGSFQPGHYLCKCPSLPPAPIQRTSLSPRLLPPSCPTPSPPSGPHAKNRQHSSCHPASCPSVCPHHATPRKPLCCPAHPMPRGSSSSLYKGFHALLGVDMEPAELEGALAKATWNHKGEQSPAPCHVQDVPCSAQNIPCQPSVQGVGTGAFLSPVQTPPT
ncbi:butyrophilin subfamily 1 member A1-like [Platysternon megacephalum]|uniref:Butyrophilin subfamily 1 member A1-like n=1 Tax=Platysternon megacephalum TaxID=55544 RepID=A0A4D9DTE6_9SAUR|nr:butyrophilin subfamily 1 member A1-like [Platysternon megacephalum]